MNHIGLYLHSQAPHMPGNEASSKELIEGAEVARTWYNKHTVYISFIQRIHRKALLSMAAFVAVILYSCNFFCQVQHVWGRLQTPQVNVSNSTVSYTILSGNCDAHPPLTNVQRYVQHFEYNTVIKIHDGTISTLDCHLYVQGKCSTS